MSVKLQRAVLGVFAVPFWGASLYALFGIAVSLYNRVQTRDWIETDAEIVSVELEEKDEGDSGVRYTAHGVYRYVVDGVVYEGTRLSITSRGTDDRNLYARLVAARGEGRRLPCFVSPKNPRNSVLNRETRIRALGSYAFFAAGFGFFAALATFVAVRLPFE
jgi:Protein of unknown function (DUF3592)